jgi:AraC-like DNA-binding protein
VLSVEFYQGAAYPFFPFALKDLTNQVIPAQQVLGKAGAELEGRLGEAATAEDRVGLVQGFLLGRLSEASSLDSIVSHAMAIIRARQGLVTVNELTEKLGYSQRYLAMKFDRFVGLGPKTIAEIVRFQNRFVRLTRFGLDGGVDFDEDYYDQSHFTKEFKRFSGLPPAAYLKASNEFLSLFYGSTSDSYKTDLTAHHYLGGRGGRYETTRGGPTGEERLSEGIGSDPCWTRGRLQGMAGR